MKPVEILKQIGAVTAAEPTYIGAILFKEHQNRFHQLPPELKIQDLDALLGFLRPATTAKLLSEARIEVVPGKGPHLYLATTSFVGFTSCGEGNERVFIQVQPKIGTRQMLELAVAAERLPEWRPEVQIEHDDNSSLVEWTIRAFVSSIEKLLLTGGIRSTHERIREELRSRVRGKVLISRFMNSLARGRADRVPCEFSMLQVNNAPNRALRWTIRVAIQIVGAMPNKDALKASLRRLDHYFTDVPIESHGGSLRSLSFSLPPNMRHYSAALNLASAVLRGVNLSANPGSASAPSVAMDMNELYEDAFYKISKTIRPAIEKKPVWAMGLLQSPTKNLIKTLRLEPDIYVPPNSVEHGAVVDTKWKGAFGKGDVQGDAWAPEKMLVRPRTADLYQVISYGVDAIRTGRSPDHCVCAIIYPCLGLVLPVFHNIEIGGTMIIVILLGWDLKTNVLESARNVWAHVDLTRIKSIEMKSLDRASFRPVDH